MFVADKLMVRSTVAVAMSMTVTVLSPSAPMKRRSPTAVATLAREPVGMGEPISAPVEALTRCT